MVKNINMEMRLETLIYENYNKLNENDKYIWSYILNNKKECENMSIQNLALRCNVSHTTILRFAQKLGLNGYSELKFYLKMENKKKYFFNKGEIINTSFDIKKTMDMLIELDFSEIYYILENCNKIFAYGTGEVQNNSIKELKRNFLSMGKLLNTIEGTEEFEFTANHINENDAIFIVSLSGENNFTNSLVKVLNNKGVKIISITRSGNNGLSKLSDVSIQFYTHDVAILEGELKIFPTSQLFIINEFLLLKYLEYKYNK